MDKDGAVLFFDRAGDATRGALDAVLAELGYVATDEQKGLELRLLQSETGLCAKIELGKSFALVLGRRLAKQTKRPIRVFSASLLSDDPIDLAVDELVLAIKGEPRQGNWGTELSNEHGDDWSDLCDGKAYFAVSAALDTAVHAVLGEAHTTVATLRFVAPPSLGAPRLDDIAKQVRLADEAELTVVAGRPCVRIKTAGATVTSFVSAAEVEVLRTALGPLVRTK